MSKRPRVSIKEAVRSIKGAATAPLCGQPLDNNKRCTNDVTWRVARPDNTHYEVCGMHMARLQRLWDLRPEAFGERRVSRIR